MVSKKTKGLGRGLDALLGADATNLGFLGTTKVDELAPSTLAVSQLRAGKYQPRTRMDEEALSELADSIRAQGIMQPILVRPYRPDQFLLQKAHGLRARHRSRLRERRRRPLQ